MARYNLPSVKVTRYFLEQVLRKRPYIRPEWCERVIQQPLKKEVQRVELHNLPLQALVAQSG